MPDACTTSPDGHGYSECGYRIIPRLSPLGQGNTRDSLLRGQHSFVLPSAVILDFAGAGAWAWVWDWRPHTTNSAVHPRRRNPIWRPKGQVYSTNKAVLRALPRAISYPGYKPNYLLTKTLLRIWDPSPMRL